MTGLLRPSERHAARMAALQMLYQWEVGGADLREVLSTYPSVRAEPLDETTQEFAGRLAEGTAASLASIDPLVSEQAEHWRIERMSIIDRLILRLAVFELLTLDTPRVVVINEALELARTFSSEPAVRFINGMLDALAARVRGSERSAGSV